MKKLIIIISAALVGLSACSYDDTHLTNRVENLENRVTALEKLCKEMNSNITALQTIVEALQNNDYVTGVTPVEENGVVVGYTITFVKSAPITIYHGKDGKDGANGSDGKDGVDGVDGKDGYTPVIGVEKDSDGIYYWTLDGEWLTDNEGNKIKAVGVDGKDGVDGEDGKDGANGSDGKDGADGEDGKDGQNGNDGANGKDGITPQLKIENDYWYISYDNGASWTQLGKATGEDGQDGTNGSNGLDGEDGDSFFQGVDISDDEYVIFTLADGTQIKLPTWYAFEQLKKQCEEMNQNISALQQILEALQNNDYVTSVQQIVENGKTIGYTIYFSKSGAVTIYHGEDGKDGVNGSDGQNGVDGKDGHSPVVGVRQDSDGIYYWTLDGEWLTDEDGNKIKAVGLDGKDGAYGSDGEDGEDGEDGANGEDGADGITPLLKIENEYWFISYDNGTSWTQLGKATGEDGNDGANGADGKDGEDGDAFFQGVDTSDKNYVILTLVDGTEIKIPTWYAFEELQKMCNQMNTNITSLQTIVAALQNNDYVTSVTPVMDGGKTIGYTINFSKSGAVTIYHGENGKDGANGANGANGLDGHSPQIGVKQHTDGIYYWTLDGEWLTDDKGNKIKAVGIDGANGSNGANGTNGIDGITPLLKIENEYWFISYDNGTSWTQLGKATGEDGKDGQDGNDGANGADGKDGDAFFQGVDTSDKNYVILTLVDGTEIKIPTWYAFEELQKMCNQMNTNITSLQTIVAALQNNDYVTSVTPVMDGGKTIGYTINFSKSGAVTIYHGENGKDGANGANGENGLDGHSPQIGVKQHTDGIYYWTLDGEWLTDEDGNKIKAVGIDGANGSNGSNGTNGIDGITPLLKIENEYWYISYDNGTSWTQLGKATGDDGKDGQDGNDGANGADGKDGDAFFQSVTQDEQYVYFTLADGTKITLPKGALLDVVFDVNDLVIMSPNTTREIGYTVTSVTESVTVEVVSSSDIKAKVVAADASGKSGNIVVTTSAVIDEYSKVIIFVSNGEKVVMKSIGFEQSGLVVTNNAEQSISPLGGEVVLSFATNMDWRVEIPATAKSWISVAATPMAMTEYSTKLNISPNTSLEVRSATVKIVSEDGALSADFVISQGVFDSFTATGSWLRGENIAVFAGNNKNQKFSYNGIAFTPVTMAKGAVTATEAHYAVYPYASNATLSADSKIGLTFASEQTRTVGGVAKANDVKVAVTPNLETTHLEFRPACAYLCVRLWGDDQAIKYVTLNSVGGEALSGAAIITPNVGGVPQCQMTGAASSIKLNCGSELNLGTSVNSATELWIAVPAVTLAQGYSLTIAGFYGGEQTITFADAISFVAGKTYTATAEVNISTNGPGMGVGGWGDGENVEGEI